jgi:hypothetical protein
LRTGDFPDRLKFAKDKPCFKKGNTQDMPNNRPISLLTSFSKIIEKHIYARLLIHIKANNIMAHEQYGFRARFSTEKAASSLINSILTAMNNKQTVRSIFLTSKKPLTMETIRSCWKN